MPGGPERRSIALVGMMGSGKSTVGALLAERLGWTFYDTDLILEAAFGKPIRRVFRNPGESAFRSAEALLVRSLTSLEFAVLATGGGLWMSASARRHLSAFAYTAYLSAPPDVLARRLDRGKSFLRPLLAGAEPEAAIRRLLAEREPLYTLANWRVGAVSEPEDVVQQLLDKLESVGLVAHAGAAA